MAVSEAKKRYRATDIEREKRRVYAAARRKLLTVKLSDATRKRATRSTVVGARENRARVKADRKALGRAYLAMLLSEQTGLAAKCISDEFIALKREQILMKRLSEALFTNANILGTSHETFR